MLRRPLTCVLTVLLGAAGLGATPDWPKTGGSIVWQKNILKEFGGPQLQWLVSESPLVDGPHLVV